MENISGMSKQDIIIAMEADKNASSIENESVLDYLDNKMCIRDRYSRARPVLEMTLYQ